MLSRNYYRADEENTPLGSKLMVKVGGGRADGLIPGEGIHYHMMTEHRVEYIARDEARQDIAWVRVTHPDGEIVQFNNVSDPLTEPQRARTNSKKRS